MKPASFALNLRRRDRAGDSVAAGSGEGSSPGRSPAAILDGGGLDLDITLEFRGLDVDRVLAGRDRLAVVVLAVPDDVIFAGGRVGRAVVSTRSASSTRRRT
jgi:hypothetical protein